MNPAPGQPSKEGDGTPPVNDDRILARRAAAGDGAAYDGLVERHGSRLHAMLLHLVNGDADLAAEFTQEAFVHAFTHLDRFQGASAFYTWLYRVARNRAFDLLARKRPVAMADEHLDRIPAGTSPDDGLARGELRDQVQRALAALPVGAREILLLREFEGLDYQAIADLLEVPVGTVKSRISRARAELREHLAGHVSAEDLS